MGSDNFEQQLGDLSGQLKALVPTLDRVEERLHQSQMDAVAAEARNQSLRKDFDDLKNKISLRLADIYKRIENALVSGTNHKNDLVNLKRDIREVVNTALDPVLKRVEQVESYVAELKKKYESRGAKLWDIVKILIAAGAGAGLTKLLG
jgi:chromosome segregation ATPase